MDHVILDLEIQHSPGGPEGLSWEDTDRLGVSVAVLYDMALDRYSIYGPHQLHSLQKRLHAAQRITTYNGWTFDLPVIFGLKRPKVVTALAPTSDDLLARIWQAMGTRRKGWTLGDVAQAMVGRGKTGHGADAPKLYQQGRWHELIGYCLDDVCLLRDVIRKVDEVGEVSNGRERLVMPAWIGANVPWSYPHREPSTQGRLI